MKAKSNLELRNILGKLVFRDELKFGNEYRLNTLPYLDGLYFIEIYSSEGLVGKNKLIVER